MQSDPDRFRPRDLAEDGALSQQAPSQPQQHESAFGASYARPQHEQLQHGRPSTGQPQYAPPRYALPQYAAPHYAAPHYATPFDARDAPLIHPAAAQASNVTPYGVPVYHAPGFGYVPQPSRGLSITALVLGLCSVVFAWIFVVVPIIGIVFGFLALRREPSGKAMAIVGLVASVLGLLWVLLFYLLPLIAFLGAVVFAAGGP
ncbi:protein of unknown function [Agrococcus baldri]|uniref:DUF4190 domain-containing protein n=1 Tax=Agrococcus baldri TaxID=153730 RepID=A0AA94HLK3_9MICO|nr:DUF4190 domain-containing protein [Agrococcus baldri]SFS08049.1 protein of unknown function [Agrococcus baldri]